MSGRAPHSIFFLADGKTRVLDKDGIDLERYCGLPHWEAVDLLVKEGYEWLRLRLHGSLNLKIPGVDEPDRFTGVGKSGVVG